MTAGRKKNKYEEKAGEGKQERVEQKHTSFEVGLNPVVEQMALPVL
jgi:hypothetical protein